MKTALSAALVVFLLVTSAFAEPRTWTATNGKTTEAILIHFDGEKVYLLKSNGKYAVLPANQLSEADNQVLDAFAAEPVKHILGKVIKIADGDTITVLDRDKQSHKIRLEGIDSPEIGQDYGRKAKQALSTWILGKIVRIDWTERDKYSRILGHVYFDGELINLRLVNEDRRKWRRVD